MIICLFLIAKRDRFQLNIFNNGLTYCCEANNVTCIVSKRKYSIFSNAEPLRLWLTVSPPFSPLRPLQVSVHHHFSEPQRMWVLENNDSNFVSFQVTRTSKLTWSTSILMKVNFLRPIRFIS